MSELIEGGIVEITQTELERRENLGKPIPPPDESFSYPATLPRLPRKPSLDTMCMQDYEPTPLPPPYETGTIDHHISSYEHRFDPIGSMMIIGAVISSVYLKKIKKYFGRSSK